MSDLFQHEKRFPQQVFKPLLNQFLICDLYVAVSDIFWEQLKRIANLTNDAHILMAVLEPDPRKYFYKKFGYYNWCCFPRSLTAEEYWSVMEMSPQNSPLDSIFWHAFVMAWFSPSKQWAIWGERSYDIAILGFNKNSVVEQYVHENELWREMDDEIIGHISSNFENFTLPIGIKEQFFLHYQND